MDESFSVREKLVGAFLILMGLIAVLTLLVIAQGKGWFLTYKTYRIKFKQGYHLHEGSLVKMFNTEIGQISRMRISRVMDENLVEISVRILSDYADLIRQNSVAEVVSPTLIGSEFVEISPGSSGYPPIHEFGTIPSRERKTLIETLGEFFNEESLEQARLILANLTDFSSKLKNHEKAWLSTVKHLDEVIVAVLQAKGTMGELVMRRDFSNRLNQSLGQVDQVLKEARKLAQDLQPTAKNLEAITASIKQETETLKAILADIKAGSGEVPGLLESAGEASRDAAEITGAVKANPLIRMTLPKGPKSRAVPVEPRQVR